MNRSVCLFGLVFCLFLAVAEPAFKESVHPDGRGDSLKIDFGVPVWRMLGLDFINQYNYLHCAGHGVNIYKKECPDPEGRSYVYPPLMALFFSWTLLLPAEKAIGLWSLFVLSACFACAYFWLRFLREDLSGDRSFSRSADLVLAFLFSVSYPVIFAFERGNNDILVMILAVVAGIFLIRKKWSYLGIILSVAAFLKIYPLYLWAVFFLAAFLSVVLGVSGKSKPLRRAGVFLLAGQSLTAAAIFFGMYEEHRYYLTVVLPDWMRYRIVDFLLRNAHSLVTDYGPAGPWIGWTLWGVSAVCFVHWFLRWAGDLGGSARRGLLFSLTFLSALMVYFGNISYDYSLILLVPLFCFLASTEVRECRVETAAGLFLLLLGYGLPRGLSVFFYDKVFLDLQVAGLVLLTFAQVRLVLARGAAS